MVPLHLRHLLGLSLDATYITTLSNMLTESHQNTYLEGTKPYQVLQYLPGMMAQISVGLSICFTAGFTSETLHSYMRTFPGEMQHPINCPHSLSVLS